MTRTIFIWKESKLRHSCSFPVQFCFFIFLRLSSWFESIFVAIQHSTELPEEGTSKRAGCGAMGVSRLNQLSHTSKIVLWLQTKFMMESRQKSYRQSHFSYKNCLNKTYFFSRLNFVLKLCLLWMKWRQDVIFFFLVAILAIYHSFPKTTRRRNPFQQKKYILNSKKWWKVSVKGFYLRVIIIKVQVGS